MSNRLKNSFETEIPCTPEMQAVCKYAKPRSDIHHNYWPAGAYADELGAFWSELALNKTQICRCAHDILHRTVIPPDRPPDEEMARDIIDHFDLLRLAGIETDGQL